METNLEKARRLYPIGTEHSGGSLNNTSPYIVNGELYEDEVGRIYSRGSGGCIYRVNIKQWAKILNKQLIYEIY